MSNTTLRNKLQKALNKKHKSSKTNVVYGKIANKLRKSNITKSDSEDEKATYEIINLKNFLSNKAPRASIFNKKQSIRNRIKQSSNKYKNKKKSKKKNITNDLQKIVEEINSKIVKNISQKNKDALILKSREKFKKELIKNYKNIRPSIQEGRINDKQLNKFIKKIPSKINNKENLNNYLENGIQLPIQLKYYDEKLFNNFSNFYENSLKSLGKNKEEIAKGQYGIIYLYKKNNIIVKEQDRSSFIKELFIYLILLKYRLPFIIPIKIDCENKNCKLLMPKANGNLDDFLKSFVSTKNIIDNIDDIIFDIIKEVTQFIYETSLHNLFYTDLKPENILWICNNLNQLKLFISDIGGFYYLYDEMEKKNIPKNLSKTIELSRNKNTLNQSYQNVRISSENRLLSDNMKNKMILLLIEFYKDIEQRYLIPNNLNYEDLTKLKKIHDLINQFDNNSNEIISFKELISITSDNNSQNTEFSKNMKNKIANLASDLTKNMSNMSNLIRKTDLTKLYDTVVKVSEKMSEKKCFSEEGIFRKEGNYIKQKSTNINNSFQCNDLAGYLKQKLRNFSEKHNIALFDNKKFMNHLYEHILCHVLLDPDNNMDENALGISIGPSLLKPINIYNPENIRKNRNNIIINWLLNKTKHIRERNQKLSQIKKNRNI